MDTGVPFPFRYSSTDLKEESPTLWSRLMAIKDLSTIQDEAGEQSFERTLTARDLILIGIGGIIGTGN
jgi:amino acid permease